MNINSSGFDEEELPYVITKRKGSRNYMMRFSLKGYGQKRVSLKTDDLAEAHYKAKDIYAEAKFQAKHKMLEGKTSFDRVCIAYVDSLFVEAEIDPKALAKAKYAKRIGERFLIGFYEKQTINTIGEPRIYEYLDWRKAYWINGPGRDIHFIEYERGSKKIICPVEHVAPSLNTLKREANVLRGVFKYAARKGIIKTSDVPSIDIGKTSKGRRPYFTREQFNKLHDMAMQRMLDEQHNPQLFYQRALLYEFINIAVETGMRTKEIFNLNWDHLEGFEESLNKSIEDTKLVIIAYGKKKLPQRLVPKKTVLSCFHNIWQLHIRTFNKEPEVSDPIFVSYKGKRLRDMKKALNALLEVANLKHNQFGEAYSAYCFRHSYATWQLQRSPPIDIHVLATNMRTSISMIEYHYSHVISEDHAERLSNDDEA
ncbi:MAG: tyrosine-type recombinase/integrase [Lentilitoribacter sp.]